MISTFLKAFNLKNTYQVNSIIYSISQLPLIGKLLPNSLYKNKIIKIIAYILSIIWNIILIFLGKYIYILLMIYIVALSYNSNNDNIFLNIFIFLSIIGSLLNTYLLEPSKDAYYAINILKFNAKEYGLSNYFYKLFTTIIGFLPFTIYFGFELNIKLYILILLPFYIVSLKLIVMNIIIKKFKKKRKLIRTEYLSNKVIWPIIILCLISAYLLPLFNIYINIKIFNYLFIISLILGIYSFLKIYYFNDYKRMYNSILTEKNIAINTTNIIKDNSLKQIKLDKNYVSKKNGFAFFHDLFVKRHKKILMDAIIKQTIVIILIIIFAIYLVTTNDFIKENVHEFLLDSLPYFTFIMYCINRSSTVTQAMFINCDHSMLTYRIYRTPQVILGIFKERLKTLIKLNIIPALFISLGLDILLYLSGGTNNNLNYLVIIISISSMAIFFCVHYLVMYYILQPYNINTEIKSSSYKIIQIATYFICYYMMMIKLPTFVFCLNSIIFCIGYSLISLLLVYKLAPKTFKLKI